MNQDLLNQVLCCFSLKGDFNEHFVNDPVLMKCGRNACKKCAKDSYIFKKKCSFCDLYHDRTEVSDSPTNVAAELLIKSSLTELTAYLDENRKHEVNLLNKEYALKKKELEKKMDQRENELISEIHKTRETFQTKLNYLKKEFEKPVFGLGYGNSCPGRRWHDISINDNSNIKYGSDCRSNSFRSYKEHRQSSHENQLIANVYSWLTEEIEIYQ